MKKGSCYITDEQGIMYPVPKEDKEYLLKAFAIYCVGKHKYSKQGIIERLCKLKEKLDLEPVKPDPNVVVVPFNGLQNILGRINLNDLNTNLPKKRVRKRIINPGEVYTIKHLQIN